MSRIVFNVDFNELIEPNLVSLASGDTKKSDTGNTVALYEGLLVDVYSEDKNENGERDNLVASGVVERNSTTGWAARIRWCCRIDSNGIRHESDLGDAKRD
jgi:hypothetical protein